jgi:hypothetical protein
MHCAKQAATIVGKIAWAFIMEVLRFCRLASAGIPIRVLIDFMVAKKLYYWTVC